MFALEHKKSLSRGAASRPLQQRRTLLQSASPVVPRAPSCPCGGSCPSCDAKSKLGIGEPGAAHEREADAVADRVMRMAGGEDNPPFVHEVLHSPGQPLDPNTRALMESRFSHDFTQVSVHAGARAADSATDLGAKAYTLGSAIVFAPGEYRPTIAEGRRLLAHELAHVVQSRGRTTALPAVASYDRFEREAAGAALAVEAGRTPNLSREAPPAIRLDRDPRLAERIGAVTAATQDAPWFDPGAIANAILNLLSGINLADRDNLDPIVVELRRSFPAAVVVHFVARVNTAVRQRQPSPAAMQAQQEQIRRLLEVRRRPGIVVPLLGDPQVLRGLGSTGLESIEQAIANTERFFVGLRAGFTAVAQPHDAATLARVLSAGVFAVPLTPVFMLGVSVGFYRHLPEDVRALAHLLELPAALEEFTRLVFSPEGSDAAEALGRLIGADSAGDIRRLLGRDPVRLAFGLGELIGPTLMQTLLGLVGIGGLAAAARLLGLTQRLRPLLMRLPRLRQVLESVAARLPRRSLEPPSQPRQIPAPAHGTGTPTTSATTPPSPMSRPPTTPQPPSTGVGTAPQPSGPGPAAATQSPADSPSPVGRGIVSAPEPSASLGDLEMTQLLAQVRSHPVVRELEAASRHLEDTPSPAMRMARQRTVERLLEEFSRDTSVPHFYVARFEEFVPGRGVVQRETSGVNIRRVAQPHGAYQVQLLIEPRLQNDPTRLLEELRHDLNAFYSNAFYSRGVGAEVPRRMPELENLPGDVTTGPNERTPAREHWHAGRILDYMMMMEEDIRSPEEAIRRIRANPTSLRP